MSAKAPLDLKAVPASASPVPQFEAVFTGYRKVANSFGSAVWIAALLFFWSWWLRPEHYSTPARFGIVSLVLAWVTLVPAYFIFIFANARIPTRGAALPPGARVAMVVTKAPSEPFDVVEKTLQGALVQNGILHDTWLADEDPDPQTLDWCRQHGVKVSTRRGVGEYQRPGWPRRTRSKEGNLAYFYDRYGYAVYDFVSQFDADHVPTPDYLRNAIAPFADPAVGYVSAPSICDSNAGDSWSARGRLYVEASMHGALQSGYNSGWAPLCIGSHYSVRTAALREIGGLGPELAEDHSTTLIFNANGWRGVHAVDAIAHGDGPATFADLILQEFQWSRSLVTILLQYSKTYVPRLKGRVRFQFLFSQLWYPMFSSAMAVMYVMPIYALVSGTHLVNVTYFDFVAHMAPLSIVLLALAYWWRSTGLFRPSDARIVSWEGIAFLLLRWPWSLFGSIAAVVDRVSGKVAPFRITPKGLNPAGRLPLSAVAPYLVLALVSGGTAWLVEDPGTAGGFYLFNLVNAFAYGALTLLVIVRHSLENGLSLFSWSPAGITTTLAFLAIGASIVAGGHQNGPKGLHAMMAGIDAFRLTEAVYPPSGAGLGKPGNPTIRFKPAWGPRQ